MKAFIAIVLFMGTSKAAQLQVILEYTSPVVFEYSFYHAQGQVYGHFFMPVTI